MSVTQAYLKSSVRFSKYDIPFVMQYYEVTYSDYSGFVDMQYKLKYENMEFSCQEPYHHIYYGWTTNITVVAIERENYTFVTPFHIVTLSHPELEKIVKKPDEFREEWIAKFLNGYSFDKSLFEYISDETRRVPLHPFVLRTRYLSNEEIRALVMIGRDLYCSDFTYDAAGGHFITEELYEYLPQKWTINDIIEFCREEYDRNQANTEYFWKFLSQSKKENKRALFILNRSGQYYYAIEEELKYGIRRANIEFVKDYDMEKGKATSLIKQTLRSLPIYRYQNQDQDYDL